MAKSHEDGLIDLHCHVLPGVDDGAADIAAAVDLVSRLADLGFAELYPTPHHKAGAFEPTAEAIQGAAVGLRLALGASGSSVTVHPAAGENMWDGLFLQRRAGGFPTYPGGRAFLLEFPPGTLPPGAIEALFQFHVGGCLPVIAHVERYPRTMNDLRRAESLAQVAALLVNLSALGGADGWGARRLSRRLVKAGLVHAVATDAHHPSDLPAIAAGLRWLRSGVDEEIYHRLLRDNPRRIIAGELPG